MKYHRLIRKVVQLQREKKLISEGTSLLVAFSGGVDSVALALCMLELRSFLSLKRLALAHINHQLRGEESYRDESFCVEFAKAKGLEVFVERIEVKLERENLEAKARELRYKALEEIRQREGFDLIATAHHLNDLVETVLLWLVRGAGREGLLGFEEKEGRVVRPLYLATREEIEDFVRSKKETWVEDSTNYDLSYARNLIRHKVIPELKKINPRLEESFLRLRKIIREEEDLLEDLTQKAIMEVFKEGELDRKSFLKLPQAIKRRITYHLYGIRNMKETERLINSIKKAIPLKRLGA
ncbi:tRNA lysidine(34) synthetase TilS [Hydrogenobacter sp. T-2]|uniref:tRNA lysidine(34) synthetase TilS n=1 Tax=Pampinifervens diazotrophicum TaxID=1632018 RepID=UPI002B258D6B|nr:tRNA lysidine(34) synthetase TilS [Hydrogenobacter sp. T-2]WPM32547.1 tRNA lysidine(34) synthetase TilS [Hydrogenobacter sp. T-2]